MNIVENRGHGRIGQKMGGGVTKAARSIHSPLHVYGSFPYFFQAKDMMKLMRLN